MPRRGVLRALLSEFARYNAGMSYILENGDLEKAVAPFKASHPELTRQLKESTGRFVERWGKNGFDEAGRLRHPASTGRPPLVSEEEGQAMARELVEGYKEKGQQKLYRSKAEFRSKSAVARRLKKRKGNKGRPVSDATIDRHFTRSKNPVISKKKPRQLPLLTRLQRSRRVNAGKLLQGKPSSYLSFMVWWDYTSLGVGPATGDEKMRKVWHLII